jgi:16S rRNA (uracil1498-N3)-methyltransferase
MGPCHRRLPRLFLERDLGGSALALDEREGHYLGHVLRLKRGDELVAFNGQGTERQARIAMLQRRGAELELLDEIVAQPESCLEITLLQGLAKADAMDLIVQKATELGVRTLVPVQTEFSVVRLDAERSERRLEHWRRIARSACEQSGRHRPPVIAPPALLSAALGGLPPVELKLALDPTSATRLDRDRPPPRNVALAIGPEGGFGAADLEHLTRAGFKRLCLGTRILRTETAAITVCALAQACWGDF